MKLISENGKDYLETYVIKINNRKIDANRLFLDVQEVINKILQKSKKNYRYLDKKQYGGNLQLLINRFSGSIASPSFFKNYVTNPALCLMGQFFDGSDNVRAILGNNFHEIMEEFFKSTNRTEEHLREIRSKYPKNEELDILIQGFLDSGDYLKKENYIDYLKCDVEKFGSDFLYVKSLDYTTPIKFSYILDRVDFRDDGIYIVDYKISKSSKGGNTFDGYLSSMLFYKWAAERLYNQPVKGGYLHYPQANKQYLKLDYSKDREKELVDKIEDFVKQFKKDSKLRIYSYTDEGYFNTNDARQFKEIMNDSLQWEIKIPVKIYIGESKDRP